MTTERTAAQNADGRDVTQLHAEWTRILDRLTGLRLSEATARQAGATRLPRLSKAERALLVAEGKALERRIANAPARFIAEVILKLRTAARSLLISGDWTAIVEGAARDLLAPDFETPQTGTDGQRES